MRAGDAAAPLELAFWGETPEPHAPLIQGPMHAAAGVNVICAPAPTDLDKAAPLKRSRSMKETLEKEFPVLD